MRKTLSALFLTALFLALPQLAHADQWVAVTYLVGTTTGEYTGLVDDSTYARLSGKLDENGMVKMNKVFWLDSTGKVTWLANGGYNGVKCGYLDTVYFRENTVTRVVPLDQDYINNLIKPATK